MRRSLTFLLGVCMKTRGLAVLISVVLGGSLSAVERCAPAAGAGFADRLRSGECFAAGERWKDAEEQFRMCRRTDPKSEIATVRHANALIRLNQPFEAAIELSELLESSPDSVPALKLYAALSASALENESKAALLLEKCLKLAPSDPEVWRAMGDLYLGQRRTSDAIHYLQTAVRLSPRDPLLIADLARCYSHAEDSVRATRLFTRAVEINQQAAKPDSRIYLAYAQYLLEQDRAGESISFFTRSLAINARSSDAYFGRASAHERMRDWRNAEADALASIRLSPKRMDSHLLLVRTYRALNDGPQAELYASRATQLKDEERDLQSVKRRSREALRLYFEEVQPLLGDQKYEAAITPSLKIVELWPSFPSPFFVLGICYSQTGRPAEALTFFEKYISLQPSSSDGHAALGILLLQQGRAQEAIGELELAISIEPGLLEARKAVASLHLSSGNAAGAVKALQAAGAPPLDNEARLMLGEALARGHEFVPALQQVDAVLSTEPANAAASDLKQRILRQSK